MCKFAHLPSFWELASAQMRRPQPGHHEVLVVGRHVWASAYFFDFFAPRGGHILPDLNKKNVRSGGNGSLAASEAYVW